MDTFKLTIELGNEAMQTGEDIASALRKMADTLEMSDIERDDAGRIRDMNGNTVGRWTLA